MKIVTVTDHMDVNYNELVDWCDCIIDSRNVLKDIPDRNENQIYKA